MSPQELAVFVTVNVRQKVAEANAKTGYRYPMVRAVHALFSI